MSKADQKTRTARHAAAPVRAVLAVVISIAAPAFASAQAYDFESDGESARLLDRVGTAMVIDAEGPSLVRTGPIIVEHDVLRHRWLMVQDSTMGVVFTEPSGVRQPYSDAVRERFARNIIQRLHRGWLG